MEVKFADEVEKLITRHDYHEFCLFTNNGKIILTVVETTRDQTMDRRQSINLRRSTNLPELELVQTISIDSSAFFVKGAFVVTKEHDT